MQRKLSKVQIARAPSQCCAVTVSENCRVYRRRGEEKAPADESAGAHVAERDFYLLAYLLIIFSESAMIIILPSPWSITSPVTSTVWPTWGMILAFLSAARPPESSY